MLSVRNLTDSNCILLSSNMDFARREARTAAYNSRRGMVSCFRGATLDLAATKVTS